VELKDVDNVSLDEFVEVVKSYTVTRIGSREIYKVMDFWIQFRWDDVIMDRELATEIYSYFYESGLISTKTISGLRKFVWFVLHYIIDRYLFLVNNIIDYGVIVRVDVTVISKYPDSTLVLLNS